MQSRVFGERAVDQSGFFSPAENSAAWMKVDRVDVRVDLSEQSLKLI